MWSLFCYLKNLLPCYLLHSLVADGSAHEHHVGVVLLVVQYPTHMANILADGLFCLDHLSETL